MAPSRRSKGQSRNAPPEEVRRELREKLYLAYTEVLREDFAAGEPFLKEYEALCEVPLDGADEAFERKRREDETLRRKRLYLFLLAKGREEVLVTGRVSPPSPIAKRPAAIRPPTGHVGHHGRTGTASAGDGAPLHPQVRR